MTIIFAEPRYHYQSYEDLRALIRLSGFDTVFIDEIDPQSDNAYVITILNGEIGNGWAGAKARIVVYDLEWRTEPNAPIPGVKEFWTGDKWHAELCQCRYVPMGSHPDLKPNADSLSTETYDVAYIGYFAGVPRRERIRQELIARGVRVSPPGAWGIERHRILSNSSAYLHVHQNAHAPGIPPLRMVVAAAYALPFITETVADAGIFRRHIAEVNYDRIAAAVPALTGHGDYEELIELGISLHQKLCVDMCFRKSVEAAI